MLTNRVSNGSSKYPLIVENDCIVLIGGIQFYITPELYTKNSSIFKKLSKIAAVNVLSTLLNRFRTQLNDPDFSVSKIYGFKNVFAVTNISASHEHFLISEFNASIKITSPKEVNTVFKSTLESEYNLRTTYSFKKTSTVKRSKNKNNKRNCT